MKVSSVVISLVPSRVRDGLITDLLFWVRISAVMRTSVTSSSDSLLRHTYAKKLVPTNILPKPFGNAATLESPVSCSRGSIIEESLNCVKGELVRVVAVSVGMISGTRFGFRSLIT